MQKTVWPMSINFMLMGHTVFCICEYGTKIWVSRNDPRIALNCNCLELYRIISVLLWEGGMGARNVRVSTVFKSSMRVLN